MRKFYVILFWNFSIFAEADDTENIQDGDETAGSEKTETDEKVKSTESGETRKEWQCEHCPYTSNRAVYVRNHTQKVHAIYRDSVDDDIVETDADVDNGDHSDGEKTVKKQTCNTREKWDYGLMYKCTVDSCGKIFSSRKFFTDHRKSDHGQLINFRCSLCLTDYVHIESLKIHVTQSHIAAGRVSLHMIEAQVYKQNSTKTSQKTNINGNIEADIMICVRCGFTGTNETLDCHCCLPKVPVFYCPCCDNPRSVFSEDREVVRGHIHKEHGLDVIKTQTNDVVDLFILALEQVSFCYIALSIYSKTVSMVANQVYNMTKNIFELATVFK